MSRWVKMLINGMALGMMGSGLLLGQGDLPDDDVAERRVHPLYGEPDRDPLPVPDAPLPSTETVDQEGQFHSFSGLQRVPVLSADQEPLGVVEDMIVGLHNNQVAFFLVRPAMDLELEPGMYLAIDPDILEVSLGGLDSEISEEALLGAPETTQEQLISALEGGAPMTAVYRVRGVETQEPSRGVFGSPSDRDSDESVDPASD